MPWGDPWAALMLHFHHSCQRLPPGFSMGDAITMMNLGLGASPKCCIHLDSSGHRSRNLWEQSGWSCARLPAVHPPCTSRAEGEFGLHQLPYGDCQQGSVCLSDTVLCALWDPGKDPSACSTGYQTASWCSIFLLLLI